MNVNENRHVLDDQDPQAMDPRIHRDTLLQSQQRSLQDHNSAQNNNSNNPIDLYNIGQSYGSQSAQQYPMAGYPYQTYASTPSANYPVFDFGLQMASAYQAVPQRNYKAQVADYLKEPKLAPVPPTAVSMTNKGLSMSIMSNSSETNHGLYNVTEPMMDALASATLLPLSLGIDPHLRQTYIKDDYNKEQQMYMKDHGAALVKLEITSPMETSMFPKPLKKFRVTATKSDPSIPTIQTDGGRPRVKSAHNVIEQRYRNKINDKFKALQDSVPTLRIVTARKQKRAASTASAHDDDFDSEHSDDDIGYSCGDNELVDLEGLEPARKLNKGTILSKSIEYIKFLELKNDRMFQEHQQLLTKAKMMGLDIDHMLDQGNLSNIH